MKKKLILVVGSTGSGKTTIAKVMANSLKYTYLDIETLTKKMAEKILDASYHDPNDRESEYYNLHVRPLEYEVMTDTLVENLAVGNNVVVCGTFRKEVKDPHWLERLIKKHEKVFSNVSIFVIWVKIDRDIANERIVKRQATKDSWKIKHWDSYEKLIDDFSIEWRMGPYQLRVFDNNNSDRTELEIKIRAAIEWVNANR